MAMAAQEITERYFLKGQSKNLLNTGARFMTGRKLIMGGGITC